jgi:purine-binding chemotaxis protein CheW
MENRGGVAVQTEELVSQYLTFEIGGEEYAASILKIREIIAYQQLTKVPKVPGWVRGVINLRGAVVPVIDLALIFRQAPTVVGKQACIVIAEVAGNSGYTVMGILVDAVRQVTEWKKEEIEDPPSFGTRIRIEYLLGMGRSGEHFSLILDTDKLLSTDELLELQSSIDAPAGGNPEEGQ